MYAFISQMLNYSFKYFRSHTFLTHLVFNHLPPYKNHLTHQPFPLLLTSFYHLLTNPNFNPLVLCSRSLLCIILFTAATTLFLF